MVVLLKQRRRRIDEVHRDRFEVAGAEIRALEDRSAAGERRGERFRNIAGAVIEAGPVGIAAIIGIAELVRRLAVPADAAREGQEGLARARSEEHTSELQSLMRISYAVFCLKNKNKSNNPTTTT